MSMIIVTNLSCFKQETGSIHYRILYTRSHQAHPTSTHHEVYNIEITDSRLASVPVLRFGISANIRSEALGKQGLFYIVGRLV